MTLQQAAGYQNRKDNSPQQATGNYQVKNFQDRQTTGIGILIKTRSVNRALHSQWDDKEKDCYG